MRDIREEVARCRIEAAIRAVKKMDDSEMKRELILTLRYCTQLFGIGTDIND